jgi:hypothetical protein
MDERAHLKIVFGDKQFAGSHSFSLRLRLNPDKDQPVYQKASDAGDNESEA